MTCLHDGKTSADEQRSRQTSINKQERADISMQFLLTPNHQ